MTKLAARVQSLTPSLTLAINAKARQFQQQGRDICSLSVGEPDFDTPDFIAAAMHKAVQDGLTRYGPAAGEPMLREAIAAKMRSDNGLPCSADEVLVTNGCKQALFNLLQVLLDPGDEVILPAPYWLSYPAMVSLVGATSTILPTAREAGYRLCPDALAAAITPRTRLVVLNSPCNPTGHMYSRENLAEIAAVLRRHPAVQLVSDEIYELVTYGNSQHVSFGAVAPDLARRTYVVNGFSKGWAMTGWRLGYLVGPQEVVAKAVAVQSQSTSNVCTFVQYGGLAALQGSRDCVHGMVAAFSQRRERVLERLGAMPKISFQAPEGAFYAFLDVSATGMGSVQFCERLLMEEGVAAVPGAAFGNDQCIRISFATALSTLEKGMERLGAFLARC